ncbi:MAG: cytochrome P450 [Alphaproteobacteria bacterium]
MLDMEKISVPGHPIVGVLPSVRKDPLKFYANLAREHGDIVRVRIGPEWLYFLNSKEHTKHIFQGNQSNYVKSKHYKRMRFFLGDGMFTTNGKAWSKQRRSAQPAFNGKRLAQMFDMMRTCTTEMLDAWDSKLVDGQEIGLSEQAMRLALDIAMRTLFGIVPSNQAQIIYQALNVILPEVERRVWAITPIANVWPMSKVKASKQAIAAIESVVEEIIAQRLDAPDQPDDLLSILLEAEKEHWGPDSLKTLRDQIVIFLVAGHETTATTLAWAWYSLSKFPLIDRRLSREVQATLGDRQVEFSDLGDLTYAQMVFQETMRLYPPGWMLTREALADDEIGGVHIPKGATVMACAYTMHRKPEYWDNPEGFDPSRFAPERMGDLDTSVYFPFGGGDRTCIGNRFAMMEAKVILTETVRRFRLELVTGQDITPAAMITIRPNTEIRMRLRRRENVPVDQSDMGQVA